MQYITDKADYIIFEFASKTASFITVSQSNTSEIFSLIVLMLLLTLTLVDKK